MFPRYCQVANKFMVFRLGQVSSCQAYGLFVKKALYTTT